MANRIFDNDYDIIVCSFSLLIRCFKKEDNIFAAQCIRWIISIIQYTEIFKFYLEYRIFPPAYVKDSVVTPLLAKSSEWIIIPDSDIPKWPLDSDTDYPSKIIQQDIAEARSILPKNWQMCSGWIVKPINHRNKELQKQYPGRSQQQLKSLPVALRKDSLIL